MSPPPFDRDQARREHQQRDPLHDLDNMRSSAAHTHGAAFGGLAYFAATVVIAAGHLVLWTVMLPVRLARRMRGNQGH